MMDFIKAEIVIPDDLESICNREIKLIDLETVKGDKFIIYYDSLDCSSCRIAHLAENNPLYEMADSSGFSVLTIFSPRIDEIEEVKLHLMMANPPVPVYVDVNGSFCRHNSLIPSDLRFHKFLIGTHNHPTFVGNPLASERLYGLFQKALIQSDIINY